MKLAICRSCKARIWFGRTEKGRRMPIDAEPVVNGNVVLAYPGDESDEPAVFVVDLDRGATGYKSHFATCPEAARYRRRP